MNDSKCTVYNVTFSTLKFYILILILISGLSLKAQNSDKQNTVIKSDTIFVSQNMAKDSIPFEDTFRNPFVKMYKYGIGLNPPKKTETKTTKKKKQKTDSSFYSPKKAAIWGAGFPGLGQIYMKKYWKLPIVYGLLGGVLYFVVSNGQKLKTYNGYISNVYDSIPNPAPYDQLQLSDLETRRNTYRKNVQIASFGTVFVWGLSIVDAVVDAHLHSFDVSNKLAMKIKPQINYYNFTYYTGIGVNLSFK
jgi:hypothetical protein